MAGSWLSTQCEQERLWKAGKKALSEHVDHVAVTKGDGQLYIVEGSLRQQFELDPIQFQRQGAIASRTSDAVTLRYDY